jgi:hypothetical protein
MASVDLPVDGGMTAIRSCRPVAFDILVEGGGH